MPTPTLLPAPRTLELVALHADTTQITVVARPRATSAPCPLCGQVSTRIHSRYRRRVLDLPWTGVRVGLDLTVRRFFCHTSSCARKIFTERLPGVVAPSARRTIRLTTWLTAIGLALGGAAGSRLLGALGVPQSRSSLLRQVSALSLGTPVVGSAIGIDEFAFRRGRRFGTIIVDLGTRRVLDVLPTVDAEQVVAWLRAHPQIQVVSRDRAYNFGEAIHRGAPQAQQVADRWHLLKNLGERLETVLRAHRAALRTPRGDLLEKCGVTLGRSRDQEARGRDEHERQVALFHRVKEAQARGLNPRAIGKLLGIARPTAYKYARMTAPPDRLRLPSGVLKPLAAYVPYIYQRWNEGCRNASQVHRELRERGRAVSPRTVSRYMAILRKEGGHGRSFTPVAPTVTYSPPAPPPPSLTPRQAAMLFSRDPQQLTERQRSALQGVLEKDATLRPIYEQVQAFRQLLRARDVCRLDAWLERAEQGECAPLCAYALGLRKDLDAVRAGVREPYSQGPVEGHVHRIKLIKRSGYGRMSFPLLRQRILLSTAR